MKFALCFLALSALAALALCAPALPSGLVRTPSGVFPSRCVHSIPSGSTMDRNPSTGRLHVHLADGTLHAILPKCDGARASLPSDYDGWEACVSPFFAPEFRCRPCSICSLLFCTVTPLSSVTLLTMTPKTRPLTRFLASLQCPINPSKHPMQVPLFFFITSLLLSASHPTPLLRALPLNPYFSLI
jgi:hypothetical protein